MTIAEQAPRVKDPKRSALLRARYRAEGRYKMYGIASLVVSVVFLIALLSNIVTTAWPAFWSHSLKLDVNLAADQIDPKAPAAADYNAMARAALAAEFPSVEGRAARKDLNSILSSGAGDGLRDMVMANPALIGQTVKTNLLLSDDADLYLKGVGTAISRFDTRGIANPSGTSGEVTVLTAANDFAPMLLDIKKALADRAAKLRADADALEGRTTGESAERVAQWRAEAAELQRRYDAPSADEVLDGNLPSVLVEINGGIVKASKLSASSITGEVLLALKSTEAADAGKWRIVTYDTPESSRMVSDRRVTFLDALQHQGKVEKAFNWLFFTAGDSREPELAGIRGAVVGSVLTLLVTLGLCLPIGVLAAIYLEEFAPKNRLTDFIEININNLAAVPSIVFGLLGLAVFLNFFGMPRSAPLVGGLVLALLVLPTIIIASRAALKAVPPSIREGALGVGASKQQAIFHHVLPLAVPGIMTGSIIGMAHALGETAPLLMIGMVAFIVDVPQAVTEAATVMPVQIYLWSDLPEPAFQYKTAAAITVLLLILFAMNGTAIWLRKKFERRW
jgi:phosphate transport system permease protein